MPENDSLARTSPVRPGGVTLAEIGPHPAGSRREDDDWYFSFYEPYRWLIARACVFPSVGNHDAGDTEHSDDRGQLMDNLYLDMRFTPEVEPGRASCDPGQTE